MITTSREQIALRRAPASRRSKLFWTLGNLLMLAGFYLLFYVGGLYTQVEFQRMAARGDNDIAPPRAMMASMSRPAVSGPLPLPIFSAPQLNTGGQIASAIPAAAPGQVATVERLVIPSIGVDSKVIEVGWSLQEQDGKPVAIWDVAEYAVGQHRGSANPGEGENIVLAGHVGGYGKVFEDLFYVEPGDQVVLYSAGRQYIYTVTERLVVDENDAPPAQRAANAQLIAPTGSEMVTMVTCWPLSGPDRFKQRVIVRAVPFGVDADLATQAPQTIR